MVNVNVLATDLNVTMLQISATNSSLRLSGKIQLTVVVKTIIGNILSGKTIEWYSENANLIPVKASGLATALASNVFGIHAKVDGVKSNSVNLTIFTFRWGTFVKAGGYQAWGTKKLAISLLLTMVFS